MSLFYAWETIQEMVNNLIAALPNIGLALIILAASRL
jgi:hypothetical protein